MSEAVLSPSPAQRLALPALILGGLAIGSSPIFVRLSEVGPIATAVWRVALALPILFLWYRAERARGEAARPRGLADYAALALPGLFIAADLVAWHWAIAVTSVANATLLANLAPIFVTLGAFVLFRTPIRPIFAAGLAVAIVGVVVLKGGPGAFGDGHLAGDGMAALAAVFYGGYILAVGRLRDRFSVATVMLWTSAVAAAVTLPLALLTEPVLLPSTLAGWAVLFGLSWISQVSGQSLITYALAWLPPAFSSLTLLIQPVAAAALAWIILSEPLGPAQGIGGVLVLAGILLARRA
ncbi:drug/metabolite transporter (DMT)-like permease [Inquilinus ginsengisoli]|uniref:Drug/metabolite transporter (DMT)-like permease n=1 Tax=Inquilinus ginsengisoli TaxID=363840 RepID=A0ABU1JSY3_9PROT|nr:DMT family transporter [Inquilinus ginsengisoli]MDR6291727.1 drug/metabolite transporter (DMT)-like permease [Inquilinus ginsengisoli]